MKIVYEKPLEDLTIKVIIIIIIFSTFKRRPPPQKKIYTYNKYVIFRARLISMGKNCALENAPRPKPEGCTQDLGHSFSHTDLPTGK